MPLEDLLPKRKYNGRTDASTIAGRLDDLGFKNYVEYLKSDLWQEKRREYVASDRPQKCRCGKPRHSIHHLTYERLGCELMEDLEAICDTCHAREHGIKGHRKKKIAKRQKKKKPRKAASQKSRRKQKRRSQGWHLGDHHKAMREMKARQRVKAERDAEEGLEKESAVDLLRSFGVGP